MKIAFIGQKGIPAKLGGVERYVEKLAEKMAQNGHQVFVYVRNNYTDKDQKTFRGVTLIHLPSLGTKNLDAISHTFLATIHALFKSYDVIHYNSIGPTSLSFLIKLFRPKTALVSTFQCQDYYHKKWGIIARSYLRFSEYMTCKIPDKTIVVSEELKKYTKNKYETIPVYIPNGAEVKLRIGDSTDKISRWDLEKDSYFFMASRFIRHKGLHYVIEAFLSLEKKNALNGKKLVLAGEGFHTSDYEEYLRSSAKESKNIIFTGPQSGETLDQLFSNAYAFIQPSESEGLSLALLEAMGYGKAVLVSDIVENKEAVADTGFVFKNKSVLDLEEKISYLINHPEAIQEKGEKAKERIMNFYSWEKIVNQIEELYNQIITAKKHG